MSRMYGENVWPRPTLERRLAEEWEDTLTKKVVRLLYDGETDCFPVVVVDGKELSPHGAFGYLVRRVRTRTVV